MNEPDLLSEISIKSIPRLLSMLDRNPYSPTYGCLDRAYWQYIQTDFPSAIYQYGTLAIAMLYNTQFRNNVYYKKTEMRDYAISSMFFWASIQNRDGSFNEWYANEHSYVATAFTAYAISESYLILKNEKGFPEDKKDIIIKAIIKAGLWLSRNSDETVLNHLSGTIIALYNTYLISAEARFKKFVQRGIKTMLKYQNCEGWFYEYGGADTGYLSVSIDFLAKYYQKTKDAIIQKSLTKALDFLLYFIHPDGTVGGEYNSRNTKYLLLHGLKILSFEFESAGYILSKIYEGLDNNQMINTVFAADDRYFIFFFLCNYLQTMLECKGQNNKTSDIKLINFSKVYSDAGLISIKNFHFHFICNFKKGGILKIFSADKEAPKLIHSDSGYFGELNNGAIISSQWLNQGAPVSITKVTENSSKEMLITITQQFSYVNYSLPTPKIQVLFKLFNHTFGQNGIIALMLSKYVKKKMIVDNIKVRVFLNRKINIKNDAIIIDDEVLDHNGSLYKKFNMLRSVTTMRVASSMYFLTSDLKAQLFSEYNFNAELNKNKKFHLVTEIKFNEKGSALNIRLNDKILSRKMN